MLGIGAYFLGMFYVGVFIKILVYALLIFGILIHTYNFIYYTYAVLKAAESAVNDKKVHFKFIGIFIRKFIKFMDIFVSKFMRDGTLPSAVPMAPTMLGYVWLAIYSLPDVKLHNGIIINTNNEFKIALALIVLNVFTDIVPIVPVYLMTKRDR